MIGETVLDPDYVAERKLTQLAADAGLVVERKQGPWWASLTRFRPAAPVRPAWSSARAAR